MVTMLPPTGRLREVHPRHAGDAIHHMLMPLSRQALTNLATQHGLGRHEALSDLHDYADVCVRLKGWATVSAADCHEHRERP